MNSNAPAAAAEPATGNVFVPDPVWLSRAVPEPVLDPGIAIVDPHHHLWDRPGFRYLLPDILEDLGGGHRVLATVFVDANAMYRQDGPSATAPVGEVEFANGIAAMSASGGYGPTRVAAGIVGFADLTLGSRVGAVLDEQLRTAPARFKGIRHASGWHPSSEIRNGHTNPPKGLVGQEAFRSGFACLESRGLSFDAWLYHPQLAEITDLARAFPATRIVLNHVGGPLGYGPYSGHRDEVFLEWTSSMRLLASCSNVVVKVGGLGMKSAGFDFDTRERPQSSDVLAEAWRPYVETCVEAFGTKRCMFESNFPVDKASTPYRILWNAFKLLTRTYTPDERHALFAETAVEVYRLDLPATPKANR